MFWSSLYHFAVSYSLSELLSDKEAKQNTGTPPVLQTCLFRSDYKSQFHNPLDYTNTNYNLFTKQDEQNLSFDLLLDLKLLKTAGPGVTSFL